MPKSPDPLCDCISGFTFHGEITESDTIEGTFSGTTGIHVYTRDTGADHARIDGYCGVR